MLSRVLRKLPISADEVFEDIASVGGARIERITSPPSSGPGEVYDQAHAEWVIVLQGWADLRVEDETVRLAVGDGYLIAEGVVHQVMMTSPSEPTVWVAVHSALE